MKILVDCTQTPVNKAGVGVYAYQTLKRLIQQESSDTYLLLVQDDDPELLSLTGSRVQTVKVKARFFRNLLLRSLLEQCYLPWLAWRYKVQIIHSLHYSFPFFSGGAKRVVTLHDMAFFLYPEVYSFVKRNYFKFFIRAATRRASRIVTVSESTRRDLLERYPRLDKTKVSVAPLAAELPASIGKTPFESPYVVFIGTLEPRKNIVRLIEAFAALKGPYRLVVIGMRGWFYESIFETLQRLNLKERVVFTGFVKDSEKFAILNGASLFVYPSLYEGFGLPVLEALSLGIPTVTSNISSLPEVAGNAALLVNPFDVEGLTKAMQTVLSDKTLREQMSRDGKEQARRFSWNETARKTRAVYHSLR